MTLRERVRDAVASEMGKAVGEALRDLLTALLSKTANALRTAEQHTPPRPVEESRWDDDDEPHWHHEPREPVYSKPVTPTPSPSPVPSGMAMRLGVGIASWLLKRRVPIWAGLGTGLLASLATLSHHPFVQAGPGVVAAAAELVTITEFTANSP